MADSSLNEEQLKAVTFGDGPLLIIAGAGTGKTTVITKRIQHLIQDKQLSPSNILALTFTEKAAQEMAARVDEILPYGYTDLWIETFHAFCDRILRQEAISIGLNPSFKLMTEAESLLFLRKHLFEFDLTYYRPLGNPTKFLQGMLSHFSRLKDDDITPEQYLEYALSPRLYPLDPEDEDEIKRTNELANAFKLYEDLKAKEGVMDYSDLISNVLKLFRMRKNVLNQYQELFQYVFVDEFQDTNYAQNEMAILLAGSRQNITVVGDDDQCLPGDTLVQTPEGEKRIASIKEGDQVLTGVGKGAIGISSVNKVFKSKKATTFISMVTRSGAKLTATYNHKMFCYTPKNSKKAFYYVYLMYKKKLGWRLGITNNLAVRLKLERSADAIIGLRAFKTVEEARYHELLWSLTYQLPTSIFKERDGVMLQGKLLERIYQQIDTEKNAKRLAEDLGINLQNYHYTLDAVTRGQSKRVKINVYQCFRNYVAKNAKDRVLKNPSVLHAVHLETTNAEVIKQLKEASIPHDREKKGIRVRFYSADLQKVHEFAQTLAGIVGGFIEVKSTIGTLQKVNMPALIMPASNLLEGLYVPVIHNNQIFYDEIVSVERMKKNETVYDLEIERTHNFIANNIVVHNSIYRWRGAAVANMMQFRSHFPKVEIITLNKNYRSSQNILDGSYKLIQYNNPDRLEVKEKIDKKLTAMRGIKGEEIEFIYANRIEDEAEEVAKRIRDEVKKSNRPYNEFAILIRANDHAVPFQRAFDRMRIPYQFLGPGRLYQQEEIKDLIAYLHVLANFEDTSSLYRVLTMPIFDLEARDIASLLNYSKANNISLFEAMERHDKTSLTDDGKEKTARICTMLKNHLAKIPTETAGQILYYFFEDSGLLGHYLDPGSLRTEKEAQNIAKFFEKLQGFASHHDDASVFAVVDWIDLAMELGESPLAAEVDWTQNNAVNILTVHSSKGLEFPFVFVINLVTQRFPSRDRKEQIPVPQDLIREDLPEGNEGLEEERRLFYVAMTRAKDKLFLTAARFYGEGKRERKVSPFVLEALGDAYIQSVVKKQALQAPAQQLSLLDVFNANIVSQAEANKVEPSTPYNLTPITYLSYSQLQTFQTCPMHYKLRYILNLPTPPSSALSYGVSVHSTLRDFFQRMQDGENVTADLMRELLKANWNPLGYDHKSHEQKAYQQAEAMLVDYGRKIIIDKPDTIAIELPFNFWLVPSKPIGEVGLDKIKIGGRIDRIDKLPDGRIEIIDYKTGSNVPTEKKLREDFQLAFYALAATEIHDGVLNKKPEEIVLTLNYLEAGKTFSTTRTKEELDAAKDKIIMLADEISKSDFQCSRGMFCKNCEFKMVCQA